LELTAEKIDETFMNGADINTTKIPVFIGVILFPRNHKLETLKVAHRVSLR